MFTRAVCSGFSLPGGPAARRPGLLNRTPERVNFERISEKFH
jgi:hypothetical protein